MRLKKFGETQRNICLMTDNPQTTEIVKTFTLTFKWREPRYWTLTSDGITGLILTASTFSEMLEELGAVVPELMGLNAQAFPSDLLP